MSLHADVAPRKIISAETVAKLVLTIEILPRITLDLKYTNRKDIIEIQYVMVKGLGMSRSEHPEETVASVLTDYVIAPYERFVRICRLSGRPSEIAASEQVQMQMKHGLSRAAPIVEHCAIAFGKFAFDGQLGRDELQLAKDGCIFRIGFCQGNEMFSRAKQDVGRRLGLYVFKGEDIVVFVYYF